MLMLTARPLRVRCVVRPGRRASDSAIVVSGSLPMSSALIASTTPSAFFLTLIAFSMPRRMPVTVIVCAASAAAGGCVDGPGLWAAPRPWPSASRLRRRRPGSRRNGARGFACETLHRVSPQRCICQTRRFCTKTSRFGLLLGKPWVLLRQRKGFYESPSDRKQAAPAETGAGSHTNWRRACSQTNVRTLLQLSIACVALASPAVAAGPRARALARLARPGHLFRRDRPLRRRRPAQQRPGRAANTTRATAPTTAAATCAGLDASWTTSRAWARPRCGSRRRWPTSGSIRRPVQRLPRLLGRALQEGRPAPRHAGRLPSAVADALHAPRHVPGAGHRAQPHRQLLRLCRRLERRRPGALLRPNRASRPLRRRRSRRST